MSSAEKEPTRTRMRNTKDSIFRSGGAELIPTTSKDGAGWLARIDVGMRL